MSSSDSSFSSSFFSSSFGASAAPPAAAAGAPPVAGAAPPAPTFERSSLTFLPSRAFARRVAQMGSSSTPAAVVKATILSDYKSRVKVVSLHMASCECMRHTVISMPSSARMRAAYEAASSEEACGIQNQYPVQRSRSLLSGVHPKFIGCIQRRDLVTIPSNVFLVYPRDSNRRSHHFECCEGGTTVECCWSMSSLASYRRGWIHRILGRL